MFVTATTRPPTQDTYGLRAENFNPSAQFIGRILCVINAFLRWALSERAYGSEGVCCVAINGWEGGGRGWN